MVVNLITRSLLSQADLGHFWSLRVCCIHFTRFIHFARCIHFARLFYDRFLQLQALLRVHLQADLVNRWTQAADRADRIVFVVYRRVDAHRAALPHHRTSEARVAAHQTLAQLVIVVVDAALDFLFIHSLRISRPRFGTLVGDLGGQTVVQIERPKVGVVVSQALQLEIALPAQIVQSFLVQLLQIFLKALDVFPFLRFAVRDLAQEPEDQL